MRTLAILLLAATALHAQAPPDDPHQNHLRFTLILSAPDASAALAPLLPPSAQPSACPQPSDIYLYSASDPGLIAAARTASGTLGPSCLAPPVHIAASDTPDTLFTTTQSSNLLAHLLDTLQQAAATPAAPAAAVIPVSAARVVTSVTDNPPPTAAALAGPEHDAVKAEAKQPATAASAKPAPENRINGAFGPAGTRLVSLTAPSSNVAQVAALLGLPAPAPGAQLIFQLTQQHHRKDDLFPPWKVQVLTRSTSSATPAGPKGCKPSGCDLPVFLHAARTAVDPTQTTLDVPPAQESKQ